MNPPEIVKDEILAALLAGVTALQDRACILLALGSGLSLGELAALNVRSFTEISDSARKPSPHTAALLWVEQGYCSNPLPVTPAAAAALRHHLEHRNTTVGDSPLFLTSSGDRLTKRQLAKRLLQLCTRLGLPPLSYDALRCTFAEHYAAGGSELVAFKQLMEYASDSVLTARLQGFVRAMKSY